MSAMTDADAFRQSTAFTPLRVCYAIKSKFIYANFAKNTRPCRRLLLFACVHDDLSRVLSRTKFQFFVNC